MQAIKHMIKSIPLQGQHWSQGNETVDCYNCFKNLQMLQYVILLLHCHTFFHAGDITYCCIKEGLVTQGYHNPIYLEYIASYVAISYTNYYSIKSKQRYM